MNKVLKILIAIVPIVLLAVLAIRFVGTDGGKLSQSGILVVPTMNDQLAADSSWCGSFQLVWNDLKNELVKKDIVFTPQPDMVNNLNKEDFNETMLSDEYYYKTYGLKNLELKSRIEKNIKDKFNQTSDIIDAFDWSDNLSNPSFFIYAMLYREFEFINTFDKLDKGWFGSKSNVKYFGIDKNTKESVGNQIDVLYYNSKDDFAIVINSKEKDELILCKKPQGNTFNEIYENMINKANLYGGEKSFGEKDEFKAPNIDIKENREYYELQGKTLVTANPDYPEVNLEKALQTINFELNEKGRKNKERSCYFWGIWYFGRA